MENNRLTLFLTISLVFAFLVIVAGFVGFAIYSFSHIGSRNVECSKIQPASLNVSSNYAIALDEENKVCSYDVVKQTWERVKQASSTQQ